ncbi:MAG: hypothetical protein ACREVV_04275 [Steroidobacteraceae bacterium]
MAVQRAIGISVHTGWGACVVVGGNQTLPEIVAHPVIEILSRSDRFCFHQAAEMTPAVAQKWLAQLRARAITCAREALAPLIAQQVSVCAIVSKEGSAGDLRDVFASHMKIHSAEGFFYRDVFRDACTVPAQVVPPSLLDISKMGKLAPAPWGRDQKLAALAAWSVMRKV